MSADAPVLMPGVDRAAFCVSFAGLLRRAGVAVGLGSVETFARGLEACDPVSRRTLYWVARVTLVRRPSDLERFDAVFAQVFEGTTTGLDPHARRSAAAGAVKEKGAPRGSTTRGPEASGAGALLPWATLSVRSGDEAEADPPALCIPEHLPSALAAVADVPFTAFEPGDLALLDGWLTDALVRWPTRRSRHVRPHAAGRNVALRQTLSSARRTGFEPVRLVRTRQVPRRRRVVMLCDVSRSMQPYTAAYLHLLRAAAATARAEVFAFSTSLTRLTPLLARSSADVAVERATVAVEDRFGGTRIATSVTSLLASHHGDACRGAIVVVASDGCDSDPPESLGRAVARLRRRAHRLLWLNPRMSAPGYAPLAGGMAAALPHCDALLPADTVASLAGVVAELVRA